MHKEPSLKDFSSTAAQRAAVEWARLDQEEKQARRDRKVRRAALTRTKDQPASGPVTVLRVHPEVWQAALRAAGGDASRIRVVSETEVWID